MINLFYDDIDIEIRLVLKEILELLGFGICDFPTDRTRGSDIEFAINIFIIGSECFKTPFIIDSNGLSKTIIVTKNNYSMDERFCEQAVIINYDSFDDDKKFYKSLLMNIVDMLNTYSDMLNTYSYIHNSLILEKNFLENVDLLVDNYFDNNIPYSTLTDVPGYIIDNDYFSFIRNSIGEYLNTIEQYNGFEQSDLLLFSYIKMKTKEINILRDYSNSKNIDIDSKTEILFDNIAKRHNYRLLYPFSLLDGDIRRNMSGRENSAYNIYLETGYPFIDNCFWMGKHLYELGVNFYDWALNIFDAVLTMNPNYYMACIYKAYCYEILGNKHYIDEYNNALKIIENKMLNNIVSPRQIIDSVYLLRKVNYDYIKDEDMRLIYEQVDKSSYLNKIISKKDNMFPFKDNIQKSLRKELLCINKNS